MAPSNREKQSRNEQTHFEIEIWGLPRAILLVLHSKYIVFPYPWVFQRFVFRSDSLAFSLSFLCLGNGGGKNFTNENRERKIFANDVASPTNLFKRVRAFILLLSCSFVIISQFSNSCVCVCFFSKLFPKRFKIAHYLFVMFIREKKKTINKTTRRKFYTCNCFAYRFFFCFLIFYHLLCIKFHVSLSYCFSR